GCLPLARVAYQARVLPAALTRLGGGQYIELIIFIRDAPCFTAERIEIVPGPGRVLDFFGTRGVAVYYKGLSRARARRIDAKSELLGVQCDGAGDETAVSLRCLARIADA